MSMFNPKAEYRISLDIINIRDFYEYRTTYVTRPPYQRKNVWPVKKQQALLDSLFRRYYIPRLVLREVRLSDTDVVKEVVDGQQRITTVQSFFGNELKLPDALGDLDNRLPGRFYSELPDELRMMADKHIKYQADIVEGIDNPRSPEHQKIATEIFWRLQQGESLNFMEVAHARLSSLVRNFLVKYADDISFDYDRYQPVENNQHKHLFFRVIERGNDRMQHLTLLARLLLVERSNGPTDIRDAIVGQLIEDTQQENGIGDYSYENSPEAREMLKTLRLFYEVFKDDPALDEQNGVKELRIEYFIISMVMLLRHVRLHYAFGREEYPLFRQFVYDFNARWRKHSDTDKDILTFSDSRQQSQTDLETRERVLRQVFFEYLQEKRVDLKALDSRRAFNEAERIRVYRDQDGICQMCLADGIPKEEAHVSWKDYQTDHVIPYVRGGATATWNGQVLCQRHNASKGAR